MSLGISHMRIDSVRDSLLSVLRFGSHPHFESPWKTRILDGSIRLLVWVIFAIVVYAYGYLPDRQMGRVLTGGNATIPMAIAGANAGTPFYYKFSDQSIITYNAGYRHGEIGLEILISIVSIVGRTFNGADYQVPPEIGQQIILVILILTAFIFLSPTVPLWIGIAGTVTLLLAVWIGMITFSYHPSSWGSVYGLILICVAMAAAYSVGLKRQKHVFAYFFLLSVLVSIAVQLREETKLLLYGSAAGQIFALGVVWISQIYWKRKSPDSEFKISFNPLILTLVLLISVYLSPYAIRGLYSLAWKVPYADTYAISHGSGHPLLVSIGYIDNPFNLAWADVMGPRFVLQRKLEDQTIRAIPAENSEKYLIPFSDIIEVLNSETYQAEAQQFAVRLLLSNPDVLVNNIVTKVGDAWEALTDWDANASPLNANFNPFLPGFPSSLLLIGILALIALVGGIVLRFSSLWYIGLGWLGISATALISPVIIHPLYVFSLRGVVLCSAVILSAFMLTTWLNASENKHSATTRLPRMVNILLGGVILVGLIVGIGVLVFLNSRFEANLSRFKAADPVEEIAADPNGFADNFNSVDLEAQEAIFAKLRDQSDVIHFDQISQEEDPGQLWSDPAIYLIDDNLYFAVKLDENPDPIIGLRLHASINSNFTFTISSVCPEASNCPYVTWQINDRSWNSERYRLYAFRVNDSDFSTNELEIALGYTLQPSAPYLAQYTLQRGSLGTSSSN